MIFQSNHKQPLAEVLRPRSIDDIIGQEDVIGSNSSLGKLIRSGYIPSLLIWGPPGCGKTSFAQVLAEQSQATFESLNATDAGVKQIRDIGEAGKKRRIELSQRTLLFVDEIHRFNKSQQDVLLPYVEKGDLILIGATTENPSYELNRALLSRCQVVIFHPLEDKHLKQIISKFSRLVKEENQLELQWPDESVDYLIQFSNGDARRLLNMLDLFGRELLLAANSSALNQVHVVAKDKLRDFFKNHPISYDKKSEYHYDLISAFIKSVRGSDADAAIYYMARMLEGGEDPVFIARRLIILASEDIGNADPRGLTLAVSGLHAVEAIGLPEAAITLAQVTTYLATAPKSNRSYMALNKAKGLVQQKQDYPVPIKLRSSKTALSKSLGYGEDYKYPHDFKNSWVEQQYLPDQLGNERFYEPKEVGYEKHIVEFINWLKKGSRKD